MRIHLSEITTLELRCLRCASGETVSRNGSSDADIKDAYEALVRKRLLADGTPTVDGYAVLAEWKGKQDA